MQISLDLSNNYCGTGILPVQDRLFWRCLLLVGTYELVAGKFCKLKQAFILLAVGLVCRSHRVRAYRRSRLCVGR